jgi:hypothetical protein
MNNKSTYAWTNKNFLVVHFLGIAHFYLVRVIDRITFSVQRVGNKSISIYSTLLLADRDSLEKDGISFRFLPAPIQLTLLLISIGD